MLHYEFIKQSDKRSLSKKIKDLVDIGKEAYKRDLVIRSNKARDLIENEEQVLEKEFMEKIEQRVELDIIARNNYLLKNKEKREKEVEIFVAAKKVHQQMMNCHEIRDELLRKDNRQTQVIQLQQMDEQLRAKNQQKIDDENWLKVQNRVNERVDRIQEQDDCLRKSLNLYQKKILDIQVEEKKKAELTDVAHLKKEMEEKKRLAKESELKDNKSGVEFIKAKSRDAKLSMERVREQQQLLKEEAQNFEDVFHCEVIKQVNKEIEEAKLKSTRLKEETRNYLDYLKKYHDFVTDDEKNRNALEDEGNRRYNCMKYAQRQRMFAGKRQAAEASHQMLLKQICEDQARKMRLEAAEKEKIPDYPFPKEKIVDKFKERLKRQKELADQIEEMNRYREMKQKEFEMVLNRAEEDKNFCMEVLEKHKALGTDYLHLHPNWRVFRRMDCIPTKNFR